MKINFNSDDDSPVKKTREIYDMIIDVTSVFHEDNKYFPQFFQMNVCINYKCQNMIRLICLKELMLIKH